MDNTLVDNLISISLKLTLNLILVGKKCVRKDWVSPGVSHEIIMLRQTAETYNLT